MSPTRFRRLRPAALAFALCCATAAAQESRLPDIGSSAGSVLSPARQAEYGAMTLAQLRHEGYILDDPLMDGWLRDVGLRLAASSDRPQQSFTFFMLRDRQINAFATLGGYIGMNAGLVLAADREDEVAGVLAHEISHVTQQHVLRGAEKAQRDSLPILLATLGAIIAAQQAGGNSSGDATSAAVMTGLGMLQQRQIDYTRDNEAEADRVGIRTLANAGFDPEAMAEFFETLQSTVRMNQGDERNSMPDQAPLPGDATGDVKKAAFVSGVTVTGILAVGFSLCRSRRAVGHHIGLPQTHDSDNLR